MNKKTLALSLVLICTVAAAGSALAISTFVKAETNSTYTSASSTADRDTSQFGEPIMMYQGFGAGPLGHGGRMHQGMFGGSSGNIEVSQDYTDKVNSILTADSDVSALLSQGYNVTQIHPIIKNIVQADGTVASQATTAIVILRNGTSGHSIIQVDVENAKVLYLETTTRTIIDKTNS